MGRLGPSMAMGNHSGEVGAVRTQVVIGAIVGARVVVGPLAPTESVRHSGQRTRELRNLVFIRRSHMAGY